MRDVRLQKTNVVWYFLSIFRDVLVRLCEEAFLYALTWGALGLGTVRYEVGAG